MIDNTIIAGNFQGSGTTTPNDITGYDFTTTVYVADPSSSDNLIGAGGAGGMTNGTNGNQVGVTSLGLGALANNGGPTLTMALLPGSPAIDHGSNAFVTAGETDQRGLARIVNGTVDIGAFEVQPTTMTSTAPSNQTGAQGTAGTFNLGSFADNTAGPGSVDVNWGDSTTDSTFTTSTQGSLGTLPHTYPTGGTFTVTVTVTNANHGSSVASFQIAVAASPEVITVNSLADNTTADSVLTLREAILFADGTLGRALTAGEQAQVTGTMGLNRSIRFNLPAGPQTITLTGGALDLTGSFTINGPGASNLTINGNGTDRVFIVGQIWSVNLNQVDAINGLTISGGKQTYGAGVLNFGTLSMNNDVVSNNVAGTSGGGGIYDVGSLALTNCTVTANSCGASTCGGGLYVLTGATATVTNSTFSSNVAGGTGSSGSEGGGICNSGTIVLTNSTLTANSAGSDGGALYNEGTMTATFCSFTNNTTGADGAGLHVNGIITINDGLIAGNTASSSGGGMEETEWEFGNTNILTVLTITNTTFANNTASGTAGGLVVWANGVTLTNDTFTGNRSISGTGGGLWLNASLTLQNSIVSGNFGGNGTTANDISGTLASGSSFNLIGTGGAGGLTNGKNGNLVGVASTGLGALANNGGPTQTIALLPGSPAIAHGSNALVAAGATDQRGFTRIVNGTVDMGAFETQMASTPPANQTGAQNVATPYSLGSFTDANAAAGPWTITVNWGDGSAVTTFATATAGALPSQSHAYAQSGTLTATVTVTDINHDVSQTTFQVSINAAVTTSLAIAGFPTLTTTGVASTFTVTALDANGHPATNYRGTIHFTSTDPLAVLPANYTFVAADNGVHTFSMTLKTVGMQSITATDTTTTSITGTQSGLQVNSAAPAVITVNSLADNTIADNSMTLREAVALADGTLGRSLTAGEQAQVSGTLGNNDTIQFNLPAGPQTITLTGGALNLTKSVTINGPGAGNLTINGNNLDRVFVVGQIWSVNLSEVVAISGLTIAGGNQVYGGGLLNFGTLTVANTTFANNTAGTSGGGGLYNVGTITLNSCAFTNNVVSSSAAGGAIENIGSGIVTINNSTFTGNAANGSGAGAASGGAHRQFRHHDDQRQHLHQQHRGLRRRRHL